MGSLEQNWLKILAILLPLAFTAVGNYYYTIIDLGDRIDQTEVLFHQQYIKNIEKTNADIAALKEIIYKEIAATRSEFKNDKTEISALISKIQIEISQVEEAVCKRLKPSAEDIVLLKTKLELLRCKIDLLEEQYSNEMKIVDYQNRMDLIFEKYMQTDKFIQGEKSPPQTVDKAAKVDGTKIY